MSKLSDEKKQAVSEWIATKVKRPCPMCGSEPIWRMSERALAIPRAAKSGEIEDDDASTVAKVHCDNCGFVALFQLHTILGEKYA